MLIKDELSLMRHVTWTLKEHESVSHTKKYACFSFCIYTHTNFILPALFYQPSWNSNATNLYIISQLQRNHSHLSQWLFAFSLPSWAPSFHAWRACVWTAALWRALEWWGVGAGCSLWYDLPGKSARGYLQVIRPAKGWDMVSWVIFRENGAIQTSVRIFVQYHLHLFFFWRQTC